MICALFGHRRTRKQTPKLVWYLPDCESYWLTCRPLGLFISYELKTEYTCSRCGVHWEERKLVDNEIIEAVRAYFKDQPYVEPGIKILRTPSWAKKGKKK